MSNAPPRVPRPPKEDSRTNQVRIFLNDAEFNRLKRRANEADVTVPEYVRSLLARDEKEQQRRLL